MKQQRSKQPPSQRSQDGRIDHMTKMRRLIGRSDRDKEGERNKCASVFVDYAKDVVFLD